MTALSFNPEVAAQICELICDGKSLRTICNMPGMPTKRTVNRWLNDPRFQDFKAAYFLAQTERATALAEESLEIADALEGCDDTAKIMAARVRIDTRKWFAARMHPAVWGERVNVAGVPGAPLETKDVTNEELARWMAFTLRGAAEAKEPQQVH